VVSQKVSVGSTLEGLGLMSTIGMANKKVCIWAVQFGVYGKNSQWYTLCADAV